ncbi:RagB/SusD family nutrient uptake outer membrane protein [Pedobacter sp. MR22-3]|uniref:RagB/SusD family nutrient uptake outer membrane protein n=1 Tax=Pedobacter sp. MR22-3 TaxID=2994552 RepID=UPI002246FCA3|nr:RagB/SusD family nutrient uptake outer membrane protein [Pedobacter sp. MR22-3]MCX2584336.1 RagB/SusD family nutrient uptake outer membrane protein [Pedobacter sp. MR22-3]
MKLNLLKYSVFLGMVILGFSSCEKYLDAKPSASLAVPVTIADFQSMLDQYTTLNENDPCSGEISAGDTYLTDADFLNRAETEQRMYTWRNSNVYVPADNEWAASYRQAYYANSVIEGMLKIEVSDRNRAQWNDVTGQAYFIRAKAHSQVLGLFALALGDNNGSTEGIVLKLNTNFNEVSSRSNLIDSYMQVIADLKKAVLLLPVSSKHVVRPSRPAAFGLLARTYLFMRDYPNAYLYADSCLQLKNTLIDYNTLNPTATYPLAQFNGEVIHASKMRILAALNNTRAKIVSELYNSFEENDLRKTIFFRNNNNGTFAFKGSYDGSAAPFSGIATDEVVLIRSESQCRMGQVGASMADLNALLKKRYKTGTFSEYVNVSQAGLLRTILNERKKELLLRGLRWMDIKRQNIEGAGISLLRSINGSIYSLPANSKRFAMPIPEEVIQSSNVTQNLY